MLAVALAVSVGLTLVVWLDVAVAQTESDGHAVALLQLDGEADALRVAPSDAVAVMLGVCVRGADAVAGAEAVARGLRDAAAVGDDTTALVTDALPDALPHKVLLAVTVTVADPVAHTEEVPDTVCDNDAHGDALMVALVLLDIDGDGV